MPQKFLAAVKQEAPNAEKIFGLYMSSPELDQRRRERVTGRKKV